MADSDFTFPNDQAAAIILLAGQAAPAVPNAGVAFDVWDFATTAGGAVITPALNDINTHAEVWNTGFTQNGDGYYVCPYAGRYRCTIELQIDAHATVDKQMNAYVIVVDPDTQFNIDVLHVMLNVLAQSNFVYINGPDSAATLAGQGFMSKILTGIHVGHLLKTQFQVHGANDTLRSMHVEVVYLGADW